jgi:hypothetical protein
MLTNSMSDMNPAVDTNCDNLLADNDYAWAL